MSAICVGGIGAVSPAGWGLAPLRDALQKNIAIPTQPLTRPGWERPFQVRRVPPASSRQNFMTHPRLRRSSPIAQFAVAAALEALAEDAGRVSEGSVGLGVILCVMTGCVNYSRRFYDEVLRDPAIASPIVFPETVFNAPASHIAALLGTRASSYTLVGDPGMFLVGLAVAADWLEEQRVDGCLVIAAEEVDWLTVDSYQLFERRIILSEGASALYLRRKSTVQPEVQLAAITDAYSFLTHQNRAAAARLARAELPLQHPGHLLCDSTQRLSRLDAAELDAWRDWTGPRVSPKTILGEGLAAGSAWQCVVAVDALQQRQFTHASVSVVGCNQQAIGAQFRAEPLGGG